METVDCKRGGMNCERSARGHCTRLELALTYAWGMTILSPLIFSGDWRITVFLLVSAGLYFMLFYFIGAPFVLRHRRRNGRIEDFPVMEAKRHHTNK